MFRILSTTFFLVFTFHFLVAQTYAPKGMVVTDNKVASKVGAEILRKGGNAVDAAVAAAFALQVTHPQAGNIGGGGFMVYLDSTGSSTTIDFREKAPLAASPTMFQDKNGQLIEGSNHEGLKSVGVPGTIAGLWMAHQKYGRLSWDSLVQPSIDLCIKGVVLSNTLAQHAQDFASHDNPKFIQHYYCQNRRLLIEGQLWKQPVLAETLAHIRDNGRDGFYKGEVAEEIAKFMKKNGGIITLKDLEKYQAIEREPIKGTYKGYDIIAMPPPSSGGVTLIEMMNMMEHAQLDTVPFYTLQYFHLLAEAMRRAYADRAEHLGDPDFNENMPIDRLTSKEFAKQRHDNIDFNKASVSDSSKFGQLYDGKSTTHISIIDKEGNAVSLTYTLEHSYGSKLGSKKLGFIFNNEMGDFNPKAGYTDSRGFIGTDANLIAPEKRMLSSMTPTIIAKDGKPYLIIGSPGGRTIINTVFQTVFNVLEYNMPLEEAIEVMKIHHQWLPDQIYYEANKFDPRLKAALEDMGHTFKEREYLGRLMGIMIDEETGQFVGYSDSSSPDGGAVGY